MEKYELLTASIDFGEYLGKDGSIVGIQNELAVVEEKLDLYTSKIDIFDLLLAVASGIISGYIDSKYIKAVKFEKVDFKTSFFFFF